MPHQYTPQTIARFYAKVDTSQDSCHPFIAKSYSRGYGQFSVQGKGVGAHVVAWEIVHGPVPPGMMICHHCDNPPCCRLDHLFLGTAKDNAQDMVRKGRVSRTHAPKGEAQGLSKLTTSEVESIIARAATTPTASLAQEYGVSASNILAIVSGRTWRHITGLKETVRLAPKVPKRLALGQLNGAYTHPEKVNRGEQCGSAKLTESDVIAIRREYASGLASGPILARKYGVNHTLIYRIVKGQIWSHLAEVGG